LLAVFDSGEKSGAEKNRYFRGKNTLATLAGQGKKNGIFRQLFGHVGGSTREDVPE
jgi:hypothetical protein